MSKDWSVLCLTCRDMGRGEQWELKTENQANHVKWVHQSNNEGHNTRVTFDG